METTRRDAVGHPLLSAVLAATDLLVAHAETPTWTLDADTTARLVQAAATLAASVAELDLRVIGHAEALDLAGAAGMRGTAQWLARATILTQGAAHTKVRLAKAAASHEPTRQALARGEVHVEQAAVICRSVDLLDEDETTVSADDKARAERHLLAQAADHDARALATLGGRLVEVLDPAGADAHEARLLEKQEQRARKQTSFAMRDDGEGLTRGSFAIPTAQASMLKKALLALAAPKAKRARDGAGSYDWAVPTPAKLGEAFVTYVERFPASKLPRIGGMSAAVVAVGDVEILLGELKAARLDTGVRISHAEFIRLACEAGVIPVWMSTADGKPLSVGRKHRFHQPHQRLAKLVERETCEHPGCHTTAWLCHLHHKIAWSEGGETDVEHAVLLCPFHHHRAHATGASYPLRT